MKLNFTMSELIRSSTAINIGLKNIPQDTETLDNILLLILNVLQPLRVYVNRPITITSGYRSKELNARVGGVHNSQHLTGQAADLVIQGMTIDEAFNAVKRSGVPFDQLIHEGKWVHVSFNKKGNRKQVLYN